MMQLAAWSYQVVHNYMRSVVYTQHEKDKLSDKINDSLPLLMPLEGFLKRYLGVSFSKASIQKITLGWFFNVRICSQSLLVYV